MPAFSLVSAPQAVPRLLHCKYDAPLPLRINTKDTASVMDLAPLHYLRKATRPVSYYALFKGWLLLSQPPGCFCDLTSFAT